MSGTLAIDFDATLHPYTAGWLGNPPADEPPTPGAAAFLEAMHSSGWRIVVHSCRATDPDGHQGIVEWLYTHGLAHFVAEVTAVKPPAVAYIDDRAVPFAGDWGAVMEQVRAIDERKAAGR